MNDTNTTDSYKQIEHSELFSSPEKFKELIGPVKVESEGKPFIQTSSFSTPKWHPFHRGMGIIQDIELGEKVKIIFGFAVNPVLPFETTLKNQWIRNEFIEEPFESIKAYFVNGSCFGTKDGPLVIVNGPKEFTFTFREPEEGCSSCGQKE